MVDQNERIMAIFIVMTEDQMLVQPLRPTIRFRSGLSSTRALVVAWSLKASSVRYTTTHGTITCIIPDKSTHGTLCLFPVIAHNNIPAGKSVKVRVFCKSNAALLDVECRIGRNLQYGPNGAELIDKNGIIGYIHTGFDAGVEKDYEKAVKKAIGS